MERILRSVIQVGGQPEADDCYQNWVRLQEHELGFPTEEDHEIHIYLRTFYGQMSAPPDFSLVREYFEKKDKIEVTARLEEVKKAQPYIRTNFLSIVKSQLEDQLTKEFILSCRDASAIAEHGRNLDKPINGKKVLRGVPDAISYMAERMAHLYRLEVGEKLEGVVSDDADEVIDEYEKQVKNNTYADRLLFGLEPVDSVCKGHRPGEYWIHCAFSGELKCLAGSSSVFDHSINRRRTMKEIFDSGDKPIVTSLYREGEKLSLLTANASHIVENGIRPVFELKLESGRRTKATGNHKWLTTDGWKQLSDLKPGDWVAVPRKIVVNNPSTKFSDDEVSVIGYLLGDGTVSSGQIRLTASNIEIRQAFMESLREMGLYEGPADFINPNFEEEIPENRAPGVRVSISPGGKYHNQISPVRVLLDNLKLYGKTASTKKIPDEMMGLSEHQTSLLLGALWSTDGSIHVGDHVREDRPCGVSSRNDIKYYSTSEELCLGVQSLLLRLGIRSTVTDYEFDYLKSPYTVYVTRVVDSFSKRLFCDLVRPVGKDWKLDHVMGRTLVDDDSPIPSSLMAGCTSAVMSNGRKRYVSQILIHGTVSRHIAERFRGQNHELDKTLDGDIAWERVASVIAYGSEMTYDMEVPEHHSFVVDDMVTHNTTLALNYTYNNCFLYGKNIFYTILEMKYKNLRNQLYVIHSSHGKFVTDWYEKDKRSGIPLSHCYVGLDFQKVRDGELDELGYQRLKIVAQDFKANCKGKPFIWHPHDLVTADDIRRKAEMFHAKYGCDGIVIDYLALMKPKQRTNDYVTSVNSAVREGQMLCANFARGRGIPLLALFQLNRQGKAKADKEDGRYDFSAIAYANEIEKAADYITYTYLNDTLRKEGKFYMGNLKSRHGAIFERMVGKILWQSKRMRALESGLLDTHADALVQAAKQIKAITLTTDDMLLGVGT